MIEFLTTHLWQSTVFALIVAASTLLFRNNGAHIRYWLWFAASMKFLLPFSLLVEAGRMMTWQSVPAAASAPIAVIGQVLAAPAWVEAVPPMAVPHINVAALLITIWICGFAAVVFVWAIKWRRIQRMVRAASPLNISAPIPVKSAPSMIEPGIVGIFKPVLLLPEGITNYLAPQELRSILAHEVCHLRRRDNLTAAVHMTVQALLWFHPVVWWIGTKLVAERERACDEAVIGAGDMAETYAEGILKVCKFYVQSPLICASGVSGADLKVRIERIMINQTMGSLSMTKRWFLAATAITLVASPLMIGWASAGRATESAAASDHLFYDLPDMVINISTPGYTIKLKVVLDVSCANSAACDKSDYAPIENVQPVIVDNFHDYVRGLKAEELQGRDGLASLRKELVSRTNALIGPARVKSVLFKEAIVTDKL